MVAAIRSMSFSISLGTSSVKRWVIAVWHLSMPSRVRETDCQRSDAHRRVSSSAVGASSVLVRVVNSAHSLSKNPLRKSISSLVSRFPGRSLTGLPLLSRTGVPSRVSNSAANSFSPSFSGSCSVIGSP